jgi:DNA-binding transcriptional MerR regulator
MSGVDEVGLTAGEVARQLGVAVTTVRSWDRRYGLGPAYREPGKHRRYAPGDVAKLRQMRQLIHDGVAPVEAARIARTGAEPLLLAPIEPPRDAAERRTERARVAGLCRAASSLDAGGLDRILRSAVGTDVVTAWSGLICPALREMGRRHSLTGRFIDSEHLLSRQVSMALGSVQLPDAPARVLLACGPEEHHSLPLEALAAALAERGTGARMLGARVPSSTLREAIDKTGPVAVVLWAHSLSTASRAQLEVATSGRPRPAVIAACGPGWAESRPAGIAGPADLAEALELLAGVT